jgi:hypothetical protein
MDDINGEILGNLSDHELALAAEEIELDANRPPLYDEDATDDCV